MEPPLIAITKGDKELMLLPQMANRHGLIAGATGTGKTVTLQVIAEKLSAIGVPVFMADIKGDQTGISQPGGQNSKVKERIEQLKLEDYQFIGCPVTLWDVFGEQGHPVRTTIAKMGPLLLAGLLQLNETQGGVLNIIFRVAEERNLPLLDFKDLRKLTQYIGEHPQEYTTQYGHVSTASIGAIQRALLALESQGGDKFFGEPALNLDDFLQTDTKGYGVVNILAAEKLMASPKVYATLLLWLLTDLFEHLPEVGDLPKPKLVFFFDEAHLLFNEIPNALLTKIEQVVRLVRSKGVGVFFVTQNPRDIPDNVLGQLGNRVQHALRAFTPREQKGVQAAAETFRPNPEFKTASVLTELGVGEALVSFLDEKGQPNVVERAFIVPPRSQIGPITPEQRNQLMQGSLVAGKYEQIVDRESAYEQLSQATHPAAQSGGEHRGLVEQVVSGVIGGISGQRSRQSDTVVQTATKNVVRSFTNSIGRRITNSVLRSIFGGPKRG